MHKNGKVKGRGKALAPVECPLRARCFMFVEYCRRCEEYGTCLVWKKIGKEKEK